MRNVSLNHPARGEPIRAAEQVALVREVERFARMTARDGMYQGASGYAADVAPQVQEARIVSGPDSQGRFSWRGVRFKPDGTYADLDATTSDRSLADPAYERNGVKAITPGTRVLLMRHPQTDTWRFDAPELGLIALSPAGGIPAGTGTAPGSAIVTLQAFNGTSYSSSGVTVRAYNTAGAVGGSKVIQLKVGPGGYPLVDVEACP